MRTRPSKRALVLSLAIALGAVGCASGGGGERPAGASSTRIVQAELQPLGQLDALQVVQRLRTRWLQTRAGLDAPILYVDGTRRGSADELRFLRADEIEGMEYMSPSDATTRFGTGHTGGAILVTSIR